jgi:hypothetical protein
MIFATKLMMLEIAQKITSRTAISKRESVQVMEVLRETAGPRLFKPKLTHQTIP